MNKYLSWCVNLFGIFGFMFRDELPTAIGNVATFIAACCMPISIMAVIGTILAGVFIAFLCDNPTTDLKPCKKLAAAVDDRVSMWAFRIRTTLWVVAFATIGGWYWWFNAFVVGACGVVISVGLVIIADIAKDRIKTLERKLAV